MPEIDIRTASVALAAAGTGFAAALPLGGLLTDPWAVAGWAVPVALLAAGGLVLLRPPKARPSGSSVHLRPRPGTYPVEAEAPALSPDAWLGRISALALPEGERGPAIDRALLAQFGASLDDEPIRLLLAGLDWDVPAGWDKGRRQGPFLRDLAAAMRLPPESRTAALSDLARRAPPLPEPGPHAWVETRILAAFDQARDRAGIASAAFSWLRFHRRDLWFALSSQGRPAPFTEGSMPLLHYRRELAAGTALPTVDTAEARQALMRLAGRIERGADGGAGAAEATRPTARMGRGGPA